MSNSLVSLSEDLASAVGQTAKSVVAISARRRFDSSGVHWSPEVVVTAQHTIRREEDIKVTTASGAMFAAELAGRDAGTDLAVLRVKRLGILRNSASDGSTHGLKTRVTGEVVRKKNSAILTLPPRRHSPHGLEPGVTGRPV